VGADEDAEQSRLSSPVGTDDPNRLTGPNGKVDMVENHKRIEALVDPGTGEERGGSVRGHL
jgi:hypothetical protein